MKYVDLVIENNSDNTDRFYTYACEDNSVKVGQKVTVPFARGNKMKTAWVFGVASELKDQIKDLKCVDSIDAKVSLTEEIIETCIFMRKRYACRYIDAIHCFTPSGNPSKTGKKRNPYKDAEGEPQNIGKLTSEQEIALQTILPKLNQKTHAIFLLHGITGSGKTEVYMQTIARCLDQGRSAIMLAPEISLTKQIIDRFIGRFGALSIAVLHSKLSLGQRYDEWIRIRSGEVKIVIGARSAVFAPLQNIGVIILDEEHEATYKSDMTPKYDSVEVAIKRVKTQAQKGIVILGSATPSVSSYYRSEIGIYQRIALLKRYNEIALPAVKIADMRLELQEGNTSIFSRALYSEMENCLASGRQVILFLNRRGYSTFISCRECGFVLKCPDCMLSLTYHKSNNRAVCHYCGYKEELPQACSECKSKYIRHFGTGTEKVEEEVKKLFPDYETGRLDLDTIKKKGDIDRTLSQFKRGATKILIGTQLVAKGLDFKQVGLVGIVSADTTLNIPDFRSAEKTFQLITQAAGRAGRGDIPGMVIIQTYTPEHYSVQAAAMHDYETFYRTEISMRQWMKYPPFSDLIQVIFTAEEEETAFSGACQAEKELLEGLSEEDRKNIFAPQVLPFFKQSGIRVQLLIKSPVGKRSVYLEQLAQMKKRLSANQKSKYNIGIDVNPYRFL